jgi:hypothetical protein
MQLIFTDACREMAWRGLTGQRVLRLLHPYFRSISAAAYGLAVTPVAGRH